MNNQLLRGWLLRRLRLRLLLLLPSHLALLVASSGQRTDTHLAGCGLPWAGAVLHRGALAPRPGAAAAG